MVREPMVRYLIALGILISMALPGYFAAYTGLRVELAGKAEERYVTEMDIRITRLETTINERFATKEDLSEFKREVIGKLIAIETILSHRDATSQKKVKRF